MKVQAAKVNNCIQEVHILKSSILQPEFLFDLFYNRLSLLLEPLMSSFCCILSSLNLSLSVFLAGAHPFTKPNAIVYKSDLL